MRFYIPGLVAHIATGSVLGCALIGTSAAQPTLVAPAIAAFPMAPTLAQAAESAWQRATQAREADGQTRRAQAEQSAASSLWAAPPALELSHRDDRWQTAAGRRETEAGLAWPLWLPGQRSARGAAVDADLALAQAAIEAGRLHFAGQVREAAWGITAQRAELDLAEAQTRYLKGIAEDVDRRVKAGDLAPADALAAQAEMLAANSTLLANRQRLATSIAQWTLLTGLEVVSDPGKTTELIMATAIAPQNQPALNAEAHPDARLAQLTVERAHKRLNVVGSSWRDPPELLLRLRQDVPGHGEAAQNSIGIGIRVPLGTDGRNLPLQASALSELDVAQSRAQRTQERLIAEAALAQASVDTAQQQLEAERHRATLLRERAALIDRSFKAGETPLSELLRAVSAATQADAGLARQQAALGLARARLQQALGLFP
ncbi:MAG: TolC family protein [Pseudomonadota bacterium]